MKAHHIAIEDLPNYKGGNAFNCSIVEHDGKTKLFYRFEAHHDYTTEIGMVDLDNSFRPISSTLKPIRQIRQSGKIVTLDDPRAISHDGKLLIVHAQGSLPSKWKWCSSVIITEIDPVQGLDLRRWWPRYGNNVNVSTDPSSGNSESEKNWSPFSMDDGRLGLVYTINPLRVIALDLKTGMVEEISRQPLSPIFKDVGWRWGDFIGGGTQLYPWNDSLAGFFHSRSEDNPGFPDSFTYHVGFYAISKKAPHVLTHISKQPLMTAVKDEAFDRRTTPTHWRPVVIYPCGWTERNNKVILSAGWNDSRTVIYELDWDEVLKHVIEVSQVAV